MSEKQWAWLALTLCSIIMGANVYVTYFLEPEQPTDMLLASVAVPFWAICTIISLCLLIAEYKRG